MTTPATNGTETNPADGRPPHPLRQWRPEQRTVAAMLADRFTSARSEVLLRTPEGQVTYGRFEERVRRTRALLDAAGLEGDDRVVLVSSNRPEALELLAACAFSSWLFAPINPQLRGSQLTHQLADTAPALVIVERRFAAKVQAALDALGAAAQIIVLGAGHWESPDPLPSDPGDPGRLDAEARPGDPLVLLYTSGSTGPAKGVVCPQGQMFWWALTVGAHLELDADDVLHTTLPLYHTNALTAFLQAVGVGATFSLGRHFSASGFTDGLRRSGATVTYLLGAMVTMLWKQPRSGADARHDVRIALSPGTPPDLWERFQERFGLRLLEGFGMTELNLAVCAPVERQRPGHMGWPTAEFEIDVVDVNDHALPDGQPGELVVRPREPHSIASGYWRAPERTVEAWRNLWFHTGDRVVRHDDGSVEFIDRIRDSIRRRGENISSLEVEQAFLDHPDVAQVACVGVPSELAEEEVMVHVVPRGQVEPDPLALLEWAQDRLAYFAVPRYVRIVDGLPRAANGKVLKQRLRAGDDLGTAFDAEAAGFRPERD